MFKNNLQFNDLELTVFLVLKVFSWSLIYKFKAKVVLQINIRIQFEKFDFTGQTYLPNKKYLIDQYEKKLQHLILPGLILISNLIQRKNFMFI